MQPCDPALPCTVWAECLDPYLYQEPGARALVPLDPARLLLSAQGIPERGENAVAGLRDAEEVCSGAQHWEHWAWGIAWGGDGGTSFAPRTRAVCMAGTPGAGHPKIRIPQGYKHQKNRFGLRVPLEGLQ